MATGTDIKTFYEGSWHEGDISVIKAADHGAWLGTTVFDGARLFDGLSPDLEAHCARINRSGRRYASVHVEAWQDNRSKLFAQATGHFLMPQRRD